ncbi:MAG TPA: hypothetical protein VH573_10555 [Mycobacteriales bacterium]
MTAILEPQSAQAGEKAPEAVLPPVPPLTRPAPVPPPLTRSAPEPSPAAPRVRRVLSTRGVRVFGAAMIALYALGVAAQPAPNGPQPVAPWWADALNTVAFFGLLTVFAGAVAGRRWTLWTGQVTGASLLALSASCPVEGHHEIAAWWFVQMAVAVAMTVLPAVLLRRTQAGSRAG